MREQTIHQGAVGVPYSRVSYYTRGFVNHEHVIVFKHHCEVDVLLGLPVQWLRQLPVNLDAIAVLNSVRGFYVRRIHEQRTV